MKSPAIAAEHAACADRPVAGNEERHGVRADRRACGSNRLMCATSSRIRQMAHSLYTPSVRKAFYPIALLVMTTACTSGEPIPTLEQWRSIPDFRRSELLSSWSYDERARPLIEAVAADFMEVYGHLPGVRGTGVSIHHGGFWMVELDRAFIVDLRNIPSAHLSVGVHSAVAIADVPPEFQTGGDRSAYMWAPPRYEAYVDRDADEIRARLGDSDMTREEMLHALIGVPFDEFVAFTEDGIRNGFIKDYR
jgi:hypothetical protein